MLTIQRGFVSYYWLRATGGVRAALLCAGRRRLTHIICSPAIHYDSLYRNVFLVSRRAADDQLRCRMIPTVSRICPIHPRPEEPRVSDLLLQNTLCQTSAIKHADEGATSGL